MNHLSFEENKDVFKDIEYLIGSIKLLLEYPSKIASGNCLVSLVSLLKSNTFFHCGEDLECISISSFLMTELVDFYYLIISNILQKDSIAKLREFEKIPLSKILKEILKFMDNAIEFKSHIIFLALSYKAMKCLKYLLSNFLTDVHIFNFKNNYSSLIDELEEIKNSNPDIYNLIKAELPTID